MFSHLWAVSDIRTILQLAKFGRNQDFLQKNTFYDINCKSRSFQSFGCVDNNFTKLPNLHFSNKTRRRDENEFFRCWCCPSQKKCFLKKICITWNSGRAATPCQCTIYQFEGKSPHYLSRCLSSTYLPTALKERRTDFKLFFLRICA